MRIKSCFAILAFMSLLISMHVAAADKAMFVAPHITPFAYYDKDRKLSGTVIEIVNKISERSTIELKAYVVPAPRVSKEIKAGHADFTMAHENEAIEEIADKVAFISSPKLVVVALMDTPHVGNLPSLKGKSVGYLYGINYGKSFNEASFFHRMPLLDSVQAIDMLLLGRIDYLASSERSLAFHLQKKRVSDKIKLEFVLHQLNSYLYLSKSSSHYDEFKVHFRDIVEELQSEAEIEDIISKYQIINSADAI